MTAVNGNVISYISQTPGLNSAPNFHSAVKGSFTFRKLYLFADVNECGNPETNDCSDNAVCSNTEGSYVCRCLDGYKGNGKNCSGKQLLFFQLCLVSKGWSSPAQS